MKFTETKLEQAFIELLESEQINHVHGSEISRNLEDVLIKDDLRSFLRIKYHSDNITSNEIDQIIRALELFPSSDLYQSNKSIMKLISNGFVLKREDSTQKDIWIYLIDYPTIDININIDFKDKISHDQNESLIDNNIYKFVNQLVIEGYSKRIPDGILYINGLPLVVFEFKSSIRENATIFNAFEQLTTTYKRDIPELFKYNAFCIISDGVNNRAGSLFASYDFYYAWRKISESDQSVDSFNSMHTLVHGMFNKDRLRHIIRNFIYMPDASDEGKVLCRYPQFYAANKLLKNIKDHMKPNGDGKGGTYFGATGCGKSFTMLFLSRLLMKSTYFSSPTIVLITDRTDLDDQLSRDFTNAKGFIGDNNIVSVKSRKELRDLLQNHKSGGVFLTTIHKFTEDTELLTDRTNVICISDEAHRSQINLDQKIKITKDGVQKSYGFAKYLHDSLPNATYVGFTGTPVDATLDVFGDITDSYTMQESERDGITKKIIYEGRAAKVLLENSKLEEIESYYKNCAEEGSNEHQIEASKKAITQMNTIIGDPKVIKAKAQDFVDHYEMRVKEKATIKGKAMFVCNNRIIAYNLYKEIIAIRPEWAIVKVCDDETQLSEEEQKKIFPLEKIKLVMSRGDTDDKDLHDMLGNKEYRKLLDLQFKSEKSNFKIAIVVDMWLTGFDVPFLDTMYIDKAVKQHTLIQTISRVNRNYAGKEEGLIVDYIGIKTQMNLALKKYSKGEKTRLNDINESVIATKDQLSLLSKLFVNFDNSLYFSDKPLQQLDCLNQASEFIQLTKSLENRFMNIVKRLKMAYDICCNSDEFTQSERDSIHFYLAIRTIIFKITKGNAPDTIQMNNKVLKMVEEALYSNGVHEIFKLGDETTTEINIFDEDYLKKIEKIKLPHQKIKLLQRLLAKSIDAFKKVNKVKGVDFSKKMKNLVEHYNERKEEDILTSEVLEDFTEEIISLYHELQKEKESFDDLGINFEEKAFYDILKMIAQKFDFSYPEAKFLFLAKKVKIIVDDKTKYVDWNKKENIKAELKVDLIILLAENGYPPITKDEVYKEILEQAENFKKYSMNGSRADV